MATKRKQYTAAFKARVALAARKGDQAVGEPASQYGAHPALIRDRKRQLPAGAGQVFANGVPADTAGAEAHKARLPEQVGRPKMDLEWLKKKSGRCAGQLRPLIDREYTARPLLGSRRLTAWLIEQGEAVSRKRAQRLMRLTGWGAVHPKPKLGAAGPGHRIYPYLLRGVAVGRPDQAWGTDTTYVPPATGFMYLAAVGDWFSRYVIAWRLSNTLGGSFCPGVLEGALGRGPPEGFNADRGAQFTAAAWAGRLGAAGVAAGTGGRGRCLGNVFERRPWRSARYEDVYRWRYGAVPDLQRGPGRYFPYDNGQRRHQALGYRTPGVVYRAGRRSAGRGGVPFRPARPQQRV